MRHLTIIAMLALCSAHAQAKCMPQRCYAVAFEVATCHTTRDDRPMWRASSRRHRSGRETAGNSSPSREWFLVIRALRFPQIPCPLWSKSRVQGSFSITLTLVTHWKAIKSPYLHPNLSATIRGVHPSPSHIRLSSRLYPFGLNNRALGA